MGLRFLGVILVAAIVFLPFVPISESRVTFPKAVGIDLSTTCENLIKNNINTKCPTYAELETLDNSDQKWFGEFELKDNFYQRGKSPYQQPWKLYQLTGFDSWRIFVDPPKGMHNEIKTITIESNFDVYKLESFRVVTDYTRVLFHDRWVDRACENAVINAAVWKEQLPDVINYMRNNCDPKHTKFDPMKEYKIETMEHDITTSYKYKHDKWVDSIKKECLTTYGGCKDLRQP